MTQKTFTFIRMLTAFFLASIMAQAVIFHNYILALIAIIGAIVVMWASKKKVTEVMVDERVLSIGGKAARLTMSIFAVTGAAISFVLMFSRVSNPSYELVGSVLAYSVCAILILYSVIFKYYEKRN